MLRIIKVSGFSLLPHYQNGDFVITSLLPIWLGRLRPGDVVIFHQPAYGRLIKFVEQIEPDGSLQVRGTDINSVDSRIFGPVKRTGLVGKVIGHIRQS